MSPMNRPGQEELLQLYQETVRPLYAYVARRACGDRELAEDVTQESWLRAVAAWTRQGLPREPLAWLKTAAQHLLADHFRTVSRRRLARVELELDAQVLEPTTRPAAALVQQGLAQLRHQDAELIAAFHIDGTSVRELAVAQACSEKAIEGRLRRARLALAQVLAPWIEQGGSS
jgi:RNA polymerase sigma-70 factor (ECF subfamily)